MFSIGKLVEYWGPNENPIVGRVKLISPFRGQELYISKNEIYEHSALLKKPKIISLGSYVVFNLKGNPPEKVEMLPNLVATIKEIKPDSLWRLITENNHTGSDVDNIVQKYCSTVKRNESVKTALESSSGIVRKERESETGIKRTRYKNPEINLCFERIYNKQAFCLDLWKNSTDELKARIIFCASMVMIEKRDEVIPSLADVIAYENGREHKIIYALLLFLSTIKGKEDKAKISTWREAHETLLTSISLAYRNGKKEDILPILRVMLPMCSENLKVFCDAYSQTDWKTDNTYITCTQKDYGSIPKCMGYGNNQNKSIKDDFTKPYFERLRNHDADPDLRVLLGHIHFDLNKILRYPISDHLDSYAYPYRLSAFVKRLNVVWRYLTCNKCGDPLFPDFEYKNASEVYTLTKFTCKNYIGNENDHNYRAYLNYCYACTKEQRGMYTIDSRECVRKTKPETNTGMWICMHCGGAKEYASQRFCPACKSMNIDILHDGAVRCKELDCGLDGAKYGKEPVSVEEIYRFDKFRKASQIANKPPMPMNDDELPF